MGRWESSITGCKGEIGVGKKGGRVLSYHSYGWGGRCSQAARGRSTLMKGIGDGIETGMKY